jgi:hypothetical protein
MATMRWIALVVVAACSPAAPPLADPPPRAVLTTTTATAAPTVEEPEVDPEIAAALAAVRARLGREKLSGFVMVPGDVLLFPSEADARSAPASAKGRAERRREYRLRGHREGDPYALRVVADLGDVVHVSSGLGTRALATIDYRYELELYVPRRALVPVLARPKLRTFDDGSGFVLYEGLALDLQKSVRPAHALLAALPHELGAGDVALSFALADPLELGAEPLGARMACEYVRGSWNEEGGARSRVAEAATLAAEAEERARADAAARGERYDPFRTWHGMGRQPTCRVASEPPGRDAPLSMNGVAFARASQVEADPCSEGHEVHRGRDGLLADIQLGRAFVRVGVDESGLHATGGCGAGSLGGKRPLVWAAAGEVPAFFPDGRAAGKHVGTKTLLRRPTEIDGRLCLALPYLSVPICHDRDRLVEVEDRGY